MEQCLYPVVFHCVCKAENDSVFQINIFLMQGFIVCFLDLVMVVCYKKGICKTKFSFVL